MNTPRFNEQQLQKMNSHPGFIAALDQSGGSTPEACAITESRKMHGPMKMRCSSSCTKCEPHHHQPKFHWRPDIGRDPVREHHGQ